MLSQGPASRGFVLTILAPLYALISAIMILLILLAGSSSSVLPNFYYLRVSTSNFKIPALLSNSTYLQDLSSVSGLDYVGSAATAQSLQLADSYTVSLVSSCGRAGADGNTNGGSCTKPILGYVFDPAEELSLRTRANISIPGLFSYAALSHFLALAYVLSIILIVVAPVLAFISRKLPRGNAVSIALASLAAVLLLCASAASVAVFPQARSSFNNSLQKAGIDTEVGNNLFIFSWMAAAFAALTAITLAMKARAEAKMMDVPGVKGNIKVLPEYDMGKHGYRAGGRSLLSPTSKERAAGFMPLEDQDSDGFATGQVGHAQQGAWEKAGMRQAKWRWESGRSKEQEGAYEPFIHAR